MLTNQIHFPMDASPEEEERRHIPPEILEEILLYLPVKPLLTFSRVSKSWRSIIFDSAFIKRHQGAQRIIITCRSSRNIPHAFSSVTCQNPIKEIITCPRWSHLRATCDDLWCVQVDRSLFLWDPPMSIYKRVPDPPNRLFIKPTICYGLGYDGVGDDYKLVRVLSDMTTLLYSLRSDCWRKMAPVFPACFKLNDSCVFVKGALHWIAFRTNSTTFIISLDVSSDEYAELATPEWCVNYEWGNSADVSVLAGNLCVGLNYRHRSQWWSMEESWTKILDIAYPDCLISCYGMIDLGSIGYSFGRVKLRPFYTCENGDVVIRMWGPFMKTSGLFVYEKKKGRMKKVGGCGGEVNLSGYTYGEEDFYGYEYGEEGFYGYRYVEKLYFSRIMATCYNTRSKLAGPRYHLSTL